MALKDELPLTAQWVLEKRKQWGDAHVTAQLKRALAGERNAVYTVERVQPDLFRTFGQPFDWNAADAELLGKCMVLGIAFAGLMAAPSGVTDGKA